MRFANSNHGYLIDHMVHWLEPEAGIYFYKLYQQYMKDYLEPGGKHYSPNSALHPFLFVSADNKGGKSTLPQGYPLSLDALDAVFKRACNKIGLESPGMHSSRHGYCYYAANVLNVDKTMLSTMIRHSSPHSIDTYYHLENLTIHICLGGGINSEDNLQRLTCPAHWSNQSL